MLRHPARGCAVVLVVMLAACGGSNEPAVVSTTAAVTTAVSTTTTMPSPITDRDDGLTGLDAELAALRVANGGRLPVDAALDLFAGVFGPIPGADPSRFERRPHDGTLALFGVLGHWDALTPEQRTAVRGLLGYSTIQSFRAAQLDPPPPGEPDPVLQGLVDEARAAIATRVGGDVPFPIVAEKIAVLVDDEGRRLAGVAIPELGGEFVISGSPDRCRILFTGPPDPSATTVAHEVFHCFQFHLAGDVSPVLTGASWIVEGSAEWAGAEVAGVDEGVVASFQAWVANTGPVFALDYAAVGIYWVAESMGADPWTAIGAMLATDGTAAIAEMGLDPMAVLSRVGTSLVRNQESAALAGYDAVWDFADSEVPPDGVRREVTVTVETPLEEVFARGGYARGGPGWVTLEGGERVQVILDGDVGAIQFQDQGLIPWVGSLAREFCLEPGGCRCGADGSVDPGLEPATRELLVGSGEAEGGPISYTIRLPRPDGGFTDGRWTGTVTSSMLTIATGELTGERTSFEAPFEIIVENGAVTSGSYALRAAVTVDGPGGSGQGEVTISGVFVGCGFSPQMQATSYHFVGTVVIAGETVPVDWTIPMTPVDGWQTTFWVPDAVTDPNLRTGAIDLGPYTAYMAASGLSVSGMEATFTATRSE